MSTPLYPAEDSIDLTEEEISQALEVGSSADIITHIVHLLCSSCRGAVDVTSHGIRRKKPHVFWRVGTTCRTCGAVSQVTFNAKFLPVE